jgi:hypothetical protein
MYKAVGQMFMEYPFGKSEVGWIGRKFEKYVYIP